MSLSSVMCLCGCNLCGCLLVLECTRVVFFTPRENGCGHHKQVKQLHERPASQAVLHSELACIMAVPSRFTCIASFDKFVEIINEIVNLLLIDVFQMLNG